MKIILILFSFCLAVEIEGEKIGETSRKSRSRNRADRDKRKLEKKTLRLVQKLQKTQVRSFDPMNKLLKRVLYFIPDHGTGYKAFDLFINIYDPNRLYNCSVFDE